LQNEDLTNGNLWTIDAVKNMFMTGENSPTNDVKVNAVLLIPRGYTK